MSFARLKGRIISYYFTFFFFFLILIQTELDCHQKRGKKKIPILLLKWSFISTRLKKIKFALFKVFVSPQATLLGHWEALNWVHVILLSITAEDAKGVHTRCFPLMALSSFSFLILLNNQLF